MCIRDRIYHEGVEKGNQEAAQILAKAKQQSDEMVATAQAEAQRLSLIHIFESKS